MINIGNDKNVAQPYVAVDGKWSAVANESVMVDGEWKPVFEKNIYRVHLYRYGEYYKTLTCKKGSYVTLEAVPYMYADDFGHYGWVEEYGATERKYDINAKIYPKTDMDIHALYQYYTKVTPKTLEPTFDTGEVSIANYNYGPDKIEIEGAVEIVTQNMDTDEIISTEYRSLELKTDGTAPYVKISETYSSSYVSGTLGNADGRTSIFADIAYGNVIRAHSGTETYSDVDTMTKTKTTYTNKLIVHYNKYSSPVMTRSKKE